MAQVGFMTFYLPPFPKVCTRTAGPMVSLRGGLVQDHACLPATNKDERKVSGFLVLFGLVPFCISLRSTVFNTKTVHIKDKIYLVYAYHFMPSLNFKCTVFFFSFFFFYLASVVWFTVCGCRNRVSRKERLKLKVFYSLAQLCSERGIVVVHKNCCLVLQASSTIVAVQISLVSGFSYLT